MRIRNGSPGNGEKYPKTVFSRQIKWTRLSTFLEHLQTVRRFICTTNPIELLHSQLRKITKSKRSFTRDQALFKLFASCIKVSNCKVVQSPRITIEDD
ncbi:MAG TPA: transposase [Balneolales bacterium]|nr:transposase [Balneolales bacterium]